MIHHKIKRLAAAKARLTEIEAYLAIELPNALIALPMQYGFGDPHSFTAAVLASHSEKREGKKIKSRKQALRKSRVSKRAAVKKTRTRAVITDETRAQVKTLAEEGKTGSQIAQSLKISLPSVQNIKKVLGLVKARK